ncbi:MAG: type II secretion system protein, partial [Aquificaceae bacterium]|nr:type II secretion system protein [Aquificaceae bacterium]
MKRGVTLTELLVAIVVSSIILTAIVSIFSTSNLALRRGKETAELTEDVRNAITTLEFVFSRWGSGVPCENNQCNIGNTIPDCPNTNLQPPPRDPMCMTIIGQEVRFFANLYGMGFVVGFSGNNNNT